MAETRLSGPDRLRPRRWSFADCVFDEANWSLIVDGRRMPMETKPLELLRQLLLRAGNLVSKEDLLDAIWPEVTVVEASLPTAVHKLRCALGHDRRKVNIIETVPRIGYRLAVPVHVEELSVGPIGPPNRDHATIRSEVPGLAAAATIGGAGRARTAPRSIAIGGALVIASVMVALVLAPQNVSSTTVPSAITQRDAGNALRKLDVGAIEQMLASGWDPNTPFDTQGNGAINYLLNKCEWDRGHDQEQMLLMVRTLIDGGARLDRRNTWGDTPYSIARAVRYCGPNHPVTKSIRTMCYAGYKPLGDRCLASYELEKPRRPAG